MIKLLIGKRGSGKTLDMINNANNVAEQSHGHVVFIDNNTQPMLRLSKQIRFINTENFKINNFSSLYGLLCGIISENYDTDTMYVDNLLNDFDFEKESNKEDFKKLVKVTNDNKLNIIFSVNEELDIPDYIKEYHVNELE